MSSLVGWGIPALLLTAFALIGNRLDLQAHDVSIKYALGRNPERLKRQYQEEISSPNRIGRSSDG